MLTRTLLPIVALLLASAAAPARSAEPPDEVETAHLWEAAVEIEAAVDGLLSLARRDIRQGLPAAARHRYRLVLVELRREIAVLDALGLRETDLERQGEALLRRATAETRLERAREVLAVLRVAVRRR